MLPEMQELYYINHDLVGYIEIEDTIISYPVVQTFDDPDITEEEREKMHIFSFITLLLYDVYVKKLLMEKIIDNISDAAEKEKDKKKNKDKN